FTEAEVWHGSEVFGGRAPTIMPSDVESRLLANDYRSLNGWDEARTHDLHVRYANVSSLRDISGIGSLFRGDKLPFHDVRLSAIDKSLKTDDREGEQTQYVGGNEGYAYRMLGNESIANNANADQAERQNDDDRDR